MGKSFPSHFNLAWFPPVLSRQTLKSIFRFIGSSSDGSQQCEFSASFMLDATYSSGKPQQAIIRQSRLPGLTKFSPTCAGGAAAEPFPDIWYTQPATVRYVRFHNVKGRDWAP